MGRWLMLGLLLLGAGAVWAEEEAPEEEADPAEVAIGERLFLETRLAHYFFARAGGNANAILAVGDPVVDGVQTLAGPIAGPFAGQAMNCRSCHFVDDVKTVPGGGNRAYDDFARQSPIPAREDGRQLTLRNSPPLVNSAIARRGPFFLHFDGEFPTTPALVEGTFTGRNFGWRPGEEATAAAHIAGVIRGDDGSGQLARDFGGSYRVVLAGTDRSIPRDFRLPPRFRIDVDRATDAQILAAVARLVAAYVESLAFENASPYDAFLAKNHLPGRARPNEGNAGYVSRLRQLLAALDAPEFVTDPEDGHFALSTQPFVFGAQELEGLRIFLSPSRGNCLACHPPPDFTDFGFHNTGVAQVDFDRVHGAGGFAALAIPSLAERRADPNAWLPATAVHPEAREPFRSQVVADDAGRTDLGMWNVFQNDDFADRGHQRHLRRLVCASLGGGAACRRVAPGPDDLLGASIALFKTPGLRTLGQGAPYLHTGSADTLEDVVGFYVTVASLARQGGLRNGARELQRMAIGEADVAPLAAFLRALNEDYE
jgi:cytochrome c peroxidase